KAHYFADYEEGLAIFQEAFATVSYAHCQYLIKAAECAAQTDQPALAYQYAKQAVLQGWAHSFWKGDLFQDFRQTSHYHQLKDSADYFQEQFYANTNQAYIAIIDSLHYIDQRLIRKTLSVKGKYQIDKSSLPENRFELDDGLFAMILTLIEEHGYPSEQNVGPEAYRKADIIVHHNLRMPENEAHTPLFKQALLAGEYSPKSFATMMDQRNIWFQQIEPYFYFSRPIPEDMPASEVAAIEARRKEYGIAPLEAVEIIKRRKFVRIRQLW
ncbi:MAG: hypothetical protein AAGM67_11075, partial [Bacteroidota bacterium]